MGRPLLLLSLIGGLIFGADPLQGQVRGPASLSVTPSLGFAANTRNGRVESGGMTGLLEVDADVGGLRWTGYVATHGVGVGCADGCDVSGQSFGGALSLLRGTIAVGAGWGALRRGGAWHSQPHVQVTMRRGRTRLHMRMEAPRVTNEVSAVLLVGIPLSSR